MNVDVIGMGAGVVDRLKEVGFHCEGINVGQSPAVRDRRFMRRRDELWWAIREWFATRTVTIPNDAKLIAELMAPKYQMTSSGKILVESKSDLKKRGYRSPDLADALMLTFAGGDFTLSTHVGREAQSDYDEFAHEMRARATSDYEYNEFGR